MRRFRALQLLVVGVAGWSFAGCATPPDPLDVTPRFALGQTRTESLMSYATVKTPLVDVGAHVGFSWQARVIQATPTTATIEAAMTRVVASLPGGLGIDTDSLIPLGGLTGLGAMFFELVGARFRYVIGEDGVVSVTGWSEVVDLAARAAGCAVPVGGEVPSEQVIADALSRVYAVPPGRPVNLGGVWLRTLDYKLGADAGPGLSSDDRYCYEGFGELECEFGGDEVTIEGLRLSIGGTPRVTGAGSFFLGLVSQQSGRRWGNAIVTERGDQLLAYHEAHDLTIAPSPSLMIPTDLASLETGWFFFAEQPWR
jgi:hypothetical protein